MYTLHTSTIMAIMTQEQWLDKCDARIQELAKQGYKWDKQLSISYAGVVLKKGTDLYVFDLEGNEYHNPETIKISLS